MILFILEVIRTRMGMGGPCLAVVRRRTANPSELKHDCEKKTPAIHSRRPAGQKRKAITDTCCDNA